MHSPTEPDLAAITKEKARKKLNKENGIRHWLPLILENDKDISIGELIYQLCNAVGETDRETVLNLLQKMSIEKHSSAIDEAVQNLEALRNILRSHKEQN
jgi:hypothetical protein